MRKKILISQRRDKVEGRNEIRECLDIRLTSLIWEMGFMPIAMSSEIDDVTNYLSEMNVNGFILSGGNDLGESPVRDIFEYKVISYAIKFGLPLLGICRGMQMINTFFGGSITPVENHVRTEHEISGSTALKMPRIVNSYHNFGIQKRTIGNGLVVLAQSEDSIVEAVQHEEHKILGIMWHPEREEKLKLEDERIIFDHFGGNQ